MHRLIYVGRGGSVELDGPVSYVGKALGLRGREWSYELGTRSAKGVVRKARDVEVEYVATDPAEADRARRIMDADVAESEPGTLVFDGEWSQRALVLKSEPTDAGRAFVRAKLTVALLDGCWSRLRTVPFPVRSVIEGYKYLDMCFDFPVDLGPSLPSRTVDVTALSRPNVRLVVYGPAVNPYVIVGANRYEVDVSVPDGGRLEIDGRDKTIKTISATGDVADCFGKGVRTGGQGGGSYVFERLPVSTLPIQVSWDNSFGFDLCWYEEEGEPPWSLS
jgi:hypothetical protein